MNFILNPSLEHRALVKIAITLWSQKNVSDIISKSFYSVESWWDKIEEIVAEKVYELLLPELLNKKLLAIIGPVGIRILAWIKLHRHNDLVRKYPAELFWTSLGTIDNKKTAEVLVKDETLDPRIRFELACTYCLVDDIQFLPVEWYNPENKRNYYLFDKFLTSFAKYYEQHDQLPVNNSFVENFCPYKEVFKLSIMSGNEVATRYFYSKLSLHHSTDLAIRTDQHFAILLRFADMDDFCVEYCDVFFFILSTMNIEQRAEMLMRYTYVVLKTLLFWPWQSLFLEMAKSKWVLLSKECFEDLLYDIVDKMKKYNNLHEVLGEFWMQTPDIYKQFVTEQDDFGDLLRELYEKGDEKNIKLLLKDLSISTRNKLTSRKKNLFASSGRMVHSKCALTKSKWNAFFQLLEDCCLNQDIST